VYRRASWQWWAGGGWKSVCREGGGVEMGRGESPHKLCDWCDTCRCIVRSLWPAVHKVRHGSDSTVSAGKVNGIKH
jgi:hypothetical protein